MDIDPPNVEQDADPQPRKQPGSAASATADLAEILAGGALETVATGVGAMIGGAADAVGGLLSGVFDT